MRPEYDFAGGVSGKHYQVLREEGYIVRIYNDDGTVTEPRIFDPAILRLADRVTMAVDESLEARFPAKALARVILYSVDGKRFESGICGARGDPTDPLGDTELTTKFNRLAGAHLTAGRVNALREACWGCADLDDVRRLVALLGTPPDK